MKLSTKFFIIAYTVVLLATGLGGMFIIDNVTDTIMSTRESQVDSAARYAADSFAAFADMAYDELSTSQRLNIARQIKNSLGEVISEVNIHTAETVDNAYKTLKTNEGLSRFIKVDDKLILESVCRLYCYNGNFYLAVRSDFTEAQRQCNRFWRSYSIVVLAVSAAGGLALFLLSRKLTRSLGLLSLAAGELAHGNYGKRVTPVGNDREIKNLADSFNAMSAAIEQNIRRIKDESDKRETFVADFTHELKTPMTAIMGYSQLLRSYSLNDDERGEAATAIYNEAKRLERLAGQMLKLYVYKNEEIELCETALSDIEAQLKTTLKYLSEKYSTEIKISLGGGTVIANRVLLLSLLYNLADNAFKSGSRSAIEICCEAKNNRFLISVKDSGRGISKENIALLTEPFFREDKSRSRELGGAGLGLSLCKEIAALHGSELLFCSEKGVGTTVTFSLMKGGEQHE